MKKMAKIAGVLALASVAFTANAGLYRWTAYSRACTMGNNISVAWYHEHYLTYKTDVIHTNTKLGTGHFGSTGWQNTDKSMFQHMGELEGKITDPWIVQGYHYYWHNGRKKPIYHWYSEAHDCNELKDARDDYPINDYP